MIFAIKDSYIVIILIVVIVFLLIFCYPLFDKKINTNKFKKEIAKIENAKLDSTKNSCADYILRYNNKSYNIKLINNITNCDLQINNIDTWQMYYPANKAAYKYKFIENMTEFMNDKQNNRIVILLNKPKHVKKVINECEMIMVNKDTDVYGINIIYLEEIKDYLNEKK